MASKFFYMIRHGESELNRLHIRQGKNGGLSEVGRTQAGATAKRLTHMKFDVMLVSPYERAVETAEIIAEQVNINNPLEMNELLIERRNPSEIVGKPADVKEVAHIVDLIDRSYHEDDYRYSDEENFNDLKGRAKKLLEYLEKRKEKRFLVVTHSIFLKMIAAFVIHRESLNSESYNLLSFTNTSNNASITVFEYNSGLLGDGWLGRYFSPIDKRWKLVAWDDVTK